MLTSLKVSSLGLKCVFYGPEENFKEGSSEIEFWNAENEI